jgi:hypothetical protein
MTKNDMYPKIIRNVLETAQKRGFDFPVTNFMDEMEKAGASESLLVAAVLPVIYCHEFAQALWGKQDHVEIVEGKVQAALPAWKHQLCQMVLSEDPLLYLADHMNDYETSK